MLLEKKLTFLPWWPPQRLLRIRRRTDILIMKLPPTNQNINFPQKYFIFILLQFLWPKSQTVLPTFRQHFFPLQSKEGIIKNCFHVAYVCACANFLCGVQYSSGWMQNNVWQRKNMCSYNKSLYVINNHKLFFAHKQTLRLFFWLFLHTLSTCPLFGFAV